MGVEYARISAMLRGRQKVRTFPLPGIDDDSVQAGVQILIDNDIDEARFEASEYLSKRAKKLTLSVHELVNLDPSLLDREIERQLIFRSIVQPVPNEHGTHEPFFPSIRAVQQLDSVMVATLFEIYTEQQDYVNPLLWLSENDAEELVDAMGKGLGSGEILSLLDVRTVRSLVHILVSQLGKLRSGKSDTG